MSVRPLYGPGMRVAAVGSVICVVTVSALLTACTAPQAVGTGRLGGADGGPTTATTPTSAPAQALTPAPTAANPTGGHGSPPLSQSPPNVSLSGVPPTKPTRGGGPGTFTSPSDHGVTVDDFCYWGTSQNGSESLFAGYAFHYKGAHDPKLLHFVAQDNFGHNTDGYVGASWFNTGFYAHDEGVNVDGYNFSGQRVVLNVYLLPAVNNLTDDNPANNRAEVTIYVPNQPAPAIDDPTIRVNCVVDYGTTF